MILNKKEVSKSHHYADPARISENWKVMVDVIFFSQLWLQLSLPQYAVHQS